VARDVGKRWGDYRFVEPSAGDGRFYELLPQDKRIGIDLSPQVPGVAGIEQPDFLTWQPTSPGQYAVIGHPPFGVRGDLARAFITRACMFADLCAFILPISFMVATAVGRSLVATPEMTVSSAESPAAGAGMVTVRLRMKAATLRLIAFF